MEQVDFNKGPFDRLKKNANIEMITTNNLCKILQYKIKDIVEHVDVQSV